MKSLIRVLSIINCVFIISCTDVMNKEHHVATEILPNKLFAEKYSVYGGGVYGGDLLAVYITDSINFRKFIGTVDDKEFFRFSVQENKLKIEKINRRRGKTKKEMIDVIDVSFLIEKKEFE